MATIEVKNYQQKFKNFSLKNVNFKVNSGTLHALIGESGSGKSVIIKSIIGALPTYKGKILIDNYKATKSKAKLKLGFSTNLEEFPSELTAYKFLNLLGDLSSIPKNYLQYNIKNLMIYFGLWEHRHKKLKSYSSGMKNRIMIIHSMINNPAIMIFDEPGANLDYKNRVRFYHFLMLQKQLGKTIFLTTHMIDELESIIDDCTIISDGKMLYSGTYDLFRQHSDYCIKVSNNKLLLKYFQANNISFIYHAENEEFIATMDYNMNMNEFFAYTLQNNVIVIYLKEIKNDLAQLKLKLARLGYLQEKSHINQQQSKKEKKKHEKIIKYARRHRTS
ncbi:ABC transporter ATP-binding protein [Spiroplasma sp. NBRC 100390]|uniref:ATP-binding cassette domain-containing protein n=1 Tax=unclassified Spiroplasma TaxID=2637901 RepID=UPI0008928AC5|nr:MULTISPECIES: ABC transporter ATP-binding protein [unclassified Spiroplasma]AOX43976.1 ABC transporter ATP-binding protein [Spiroplasma sp. TU-14]APE13446.1 ABC transporter ATP-binding protein [Spiroplasma sp. NBRC 100390]